MRSTTRPMPFPGRLFQFRPRIAPSVRRRADVFMGGPHCSGVDQPPARRSRKFLWLEGLFSNASESFIGNFITPFAMAFGATNGQIGALTSATNAASAIGLLPGARLEERSNSRKQIFLLSSGVLARLLLLALVLLPLLSGNTIVVYGTIVIVVLRGFLNQLSYPAWSALVSDLVPEQIRGRYFGSRNIAVGLSALVCTPLAGYLITAAGSPFGYQLSFTLALGMGLVGTLLFAQVDEPDKIRSVHTRGLTLGEIISVFTRSPRFTAFTALAFFWHLSLQTAGPFFAVYQIKNLGASVVHIGFLSSIGAFTSMVGQRVWGVQNDRRGAVWVMGFTGFLIPAVPVMWIFAPGWWYLPFIEAFSSFLWAGYWLANFNLLLSITPDERRSRYVAVYHSVVSIAAFIGPLIGGILVNMCGMKALFGISAAGRVVVSVLFLLLVHEGARKGGNG